MTDICKFFKVKRGIGIEDTDEYVVVEACSSYDSALQGYNIVCDRAELSKVVKWIEDNQKNLAEYVSNTFDEGKYTFGLTLVKSTLNIQSFTQEFVEKCGSVQAFLDRYGVSSSLEFSEGEVKEERVDIAEFDNKSIFSQEIEEEPDDDFEMPKSLTSYNKDAENEPVDSYSEMEVDKSEPSSEFQTNAFDSSKSIESVDVLDSFVQKYENDNANSEVLVNDDAVDTSVLEAETVEVNGIEESAVAEKLDSIKSAEDISVKNKEGIVDSFEEPHLNYSNTAVALNPEETYAIECDGIEIPALQFKNGKVVVPFSQLSNLVNQIVSATTALENKDASGFEILTTDTKYTAAQILERYAPTVVKEFLLNYVRTAETDTDLIRITKLLNEFCNFVVSKKKTSFGKEVQPYE